MTYRTMRDMNLKQMSVFREVMVTGSVSEAARNLNRTQPSVSHTLATLEDELGMKLFDRRGGRLHAVPEAHYLFEECDALLRRVDSVSRNMKRIQTMQTGELRVVSMPGPAATLLPDLICKQIEHRTDISATLISRSSDAVLQLVGAQQFDIGVADHDPNRAIETSLLATRVFQFDCLCAVAADTPLAGREYITPQDLDGHAMAALFPEHLSRQRLIETFSAQQSRLSIRFTGQFFLPLLTYVARGMACAVVDPLTAHSWNISNRDAERIVFRPFRPAVQFGVDLIVPAYRPASVLTKSFMARIVLAMEELGGLEETAQLP